MQLLSDRELLFMGEIYVNGPIRFGHKPTVARLVKRGFCFEKKIRGKLFYELTDAGRVEYNKQVRATVR